MPPYAFHLLTGGTAALVASAAARALPEPTPMGSRFYLWFYRFTHVLLANFDKVTDAGKPGGN
ncbi:MAG: hypothetical protein ABSH44_06935 [Bryobacteraceae bacterium]|jgi:hypothetical protein